MNQAPKYSKIQLILHGVISGMVDTPNVGEELIEHEDCGMFITGNKLIIVEDIKDETGETNTVTEGTVYDLTNIKQYKTYAL